MLDISKMKEDVGYSEDGNGRTAFAQKWAPQLDADTLALIDLFVEDRLAKGFSKKAAASYKSLTTRYCVTGQLSRGKSGNSMKSAVRAFIEFCEAFAAGQELDDEEELDDEVGATDEES